MDKDFSTGDSIKTSLSSWTFNKDAAKNFDVHVKKSVPGYEIGHEIICKYIDYFINLPPNIIYDLGCSTGNLLNKIKLRHPKKNTKLIGIDNQEEMLNLARKNCANDNNLEFLYSDLCEFKFKNCSCIISYYTVQFISPAFRQIIINKIYDSLSWGGAFFLFEKTRGSDARFQDINSHVYNEYKLLMGYNCNEIMSKTRSLTGILEPFSDQANIDMLRRAGFKDIEYIFANICFKGWLCIK